MYFLKVTGRLMKWVLVAFFVLWVSGQSVFSHSSDFVFARWSQAQSDGSVELSLSIQISDNPNIESREQAVEVLTSLMQVRSGAEGGFVPVGNMAVASFDDGISFPQDSPVPIGGARLEELESGAVEEGGRKKHEILTLKWKWKPLPDEEQMSFFLPDDCQQNVVFWWAGAQVPDLPPGKEIPWQIMLGGDESFPVALMAKKDGETKDGVTVMTVWKILSVAAIVWLGVLVAGVMVVIRVSCRRRKKEEEISQSR